MVQQTNFTFSVLVDAVIARTGRADQLENIISWANATMREIQNIGLFSKDLIEGSVVVPDAGGTDPGVYIWTRPQYLSYLRTFRYPNLIYPDFIMPGKRQLRDELKLNDYFYYAVDTAYVLKGICYNETLDFAYYRRFPRLTYYNPTTDDVPFTGYTGPRPCNYDELTDTYTYATAYDVDDDTRALARFICTNWLLLGYYDMVQEGVLMKLYNHTGDSNRSKSAYSLYQGYKADMESRESFETVGA